MTGEHDTRDSNQMEGSSQNWISPEDGLLLDQNVQRKKNCACKLGSFVLCTKNVLCSCFHIWLDDVLDIVPCC
jgi:hypothetical protein